MRCFVLAILLASAVLVPVRGAADVSVDVHISPPPPIVVTAPPALVVVPGAPEVLYAPSLQVDLFVYGARWYYWHGGYWFVGPSHSGPWTHIVIDAVPRPILAVPVKYYRVPPGNLKQAPGGPPGQAGPPAGPPGQAGPPGHGKGKGRR